MNLAQAISFTFSNRREWIESKGAETIRINSNHVLRVLGDVDCADLLPMHFVQLQQALKSEGKAAGTINRICAILHTILSELYFNKIITYVPKYKRIKEPPSQRGYFTKNEIRLLIDTAPSVPDGQLLQDSIVFAIYLGERQGELLKVTWQDIDLEKRTVIFRDTKNDSDHKLILTDVVYEMLQRRYEERIDDGNVFPWTDRWTLLRRFKRLKNVCNMPKDNRLWHSLRHTCATWLVESGTPIRSVMGVLNHRNINTTLIYAKCTDDAKADALSQINL